MGKSLYRYVLRHSLRQQILLTLTAVLSFPFLYMFYELPKTIVNQAIQGKKITFPVEFGGFSFDQVEYLMLLCAGLLALVIVNQSFKYLNNIQRGLVGERMLRRLRYELYSRVLRFPLPAFRKKSAGEIIAMITAEVEPLGGFIGDAIAVPVFQGGTLLVILAFLLWQNVYMALAAVALYPLQFYLIPKLQRKVNRLAKERVRRVRNLSDRIGETVGGIAEIHANGTARYELADFSHRLGGIYEVRFKIYLWKFVIKFINNTINQLGPFFFLLIGGYFAIMGQLDVGTLLAAIAAHKDLAAPWKELLAYYQQREDARIKFEQVIEQFEVAGMQPHEALVADPGPDVPLKGDVQGNNVAFVDDSGNPVIEGANFRFGIDRHAAIVGDSGSGKDALARLIARQYQWSSGTLRVGEVNLAALPEAFLGKHIGYVGEAAYLFSAGVRDNLLYGLRQRPVGEAVGAGGAQRERYRREAAASGNSTDDIFAQWVNFAGAGADGEAEAVRRAIEVLGVVDMDSDIYRMGLRGRIDPETRPDLARLFLEARAALRSRLADPEIAPLVEVFDENRYNANATLGENLLFGTPVGASFDMDRLAEHPYVLKVIEEAGLAAHLLEAGSRIASTMIELFADLPPSHEFFEQFSFIRSDDLPEYQALVNRIGREGLGDASAEDRTMLLSLPFRLIEARHRLGVIDAAIQERVLAARRIFARNLTPALKGAVEFFDSSRYNAAATIQDNILFGRIAYGQARGAERVATLVGDVIEALGLRRAVLEVGLEFQVGIGGSRLSAVQRQKLGLARAILKQPDLIVLGDALAAFDAVTQRRILDNVRREFQGRGVLVTLNTIEDADGFDMAIVMRDGRVVESGHPSGLSGKKAGPTALSAAK